MTGATQAPETCDIAVVGAGILGLAVARELSLRRPRASIGVLEREDTVGSHQTGHNSGVIHAGIYYAPGSLKAKLCVEGAQEMYDFCELHGISHARAGKLIVALTQQQLPALDELERRGRANGVTGLLRLGAGELREVEPHCAGLAGLHSPGTGVVDFGEVARAIAAHLARKGVALVTSCGVTAIDQTGGRIVLSHRLGETRARFAVFCAGAWSDRLAMRAGAPADPRIVPFRGAYLRLRPERQHLVRSLIYPVPDPSLPFLGVHLTRHIGGEVSLGPTTLIAGARDAYRPTTLRARDVATTLGWPGSWRLCRRWWRTGLRELHHAVSRRALAMEAVRYVPELTPDDFTPYFAGVRAQALRRDGALVDDFVFSRTERALHVRNAPSPAATSAFSIARSIADRVQEEIGNPAFSQAGGARRGE